MTEQVLPKICIILGAGASHDVRSAGSPVLNPGLQPPLAGDLFNLEEKSAFKPILAEYGGAVVLAQNLATQSARPNFDLERELRGIAEHHSVQVRPLRKRRGIYLLLGAGAHERW